MSTKVNKNKTLLDQYKAHQLLGNFKTKLTLIDITRVKF